MENKMKYIIILLIAVIVIMGAVMAILLTTNSTNNESGQESEKGVSSNLNILGTNIFENNLKLDYYDPYLSVYGFTNLTKKELMDLNGYTADTKVLDKEGNTIDSYSTDIDEYSYTGGEVLLGMLDVSNADNISKVIVSITDNNGNKIQTIEKDY